MKKKIILRIIGYLFAAVVSIGIVFMILRYSEQEETRKDKAQVEMAKTLAAQESELRKEIKEANAAKISLDSANTALLESLKEYRLLKGPCCEHVCSLNHKKE
jgi:flagellar basal body-associated protein FliL